MGLVTFQADGRMMAVLCDGRASLDGEPRQFMSYAGNYTFDGTTLSTRVDASSDASRIGGDQVRTVRFENGGAMVLAPPRRLYAGSCSTRSSCGNGWTARFDLCGQLRSCGRPQHKLLFQKSSTGRSTSSGYHGDEHPGGLPPAAAGLDVGLEQNE